MNCKPFLCFMVLLFACTVSPATAQSSGQATIAQSSPGQTVPPRQPGTVPASGREATRWEPWSTMRMAAAPILGWKIGIVADDLPNTYLWKSLEDTDALKLSFIEASSTQLLSEEIPKPVNYNLQPGELKAIQDKLFGLNIKIVAYRIPSIDTDASSARKLFEFAKAINIETIVAEKMPTDPAVVDMLANEYEINVAFCENPNKVLAAIQIYSKRLGVCGDTQVWSQDGIKLSEALNQLKDRLLVVNLHYKTSNASSDSKIKSDAFTDKAQLLEDMFRLQIKPSLLAVETTGQNATVTALSKSLDEFENDLRPIMTNKVNAISRTAATRRDINLIPPEDKQKIDASLPVKATAPPKQPRKLLVLDLNVAYGGHRSIPAENYALEMMGKKTGAYEAVFSNNLDNLKYPKIKDYDAIFLNNTVGMIFVDLTVRDGLLRFIREGGGIGGNHSTTHASMDWPEFHEMIGVTRGVHRQNTEKVWIKIDDPKSPLTAAFGRQEFEYADEFFRFVGPLYSREKLHVLLSMDVAKTDMNQGTPFMPGQLWRSDADYAVSWIRSYGKGRVFFSILGHNPTLFESPQLARAFLDGIQYILGDLPADDTPSRERAK